MNNAGVQDEKRIPGLLRELGAAQAASIVVGVVIGSGIFLVPAEMMRAAGSAKLVYLAWIVGGIFSFCGAVTYAELGAMKPQAGGEYVYISVRLDVDDCDQAFVPGCDLDRNRPGPRQLLFPFISHR
jgi:amino acid permease